MKNSPAPAPDHDEHVLAASQTSNSNITRYLNSSATIADWNEPRRHSEMITEIHAMRIVWGCPRNTFDSYLEFWSTMPGLTDYQFRCVASWAFAKCAGLLTTERKTV